MLNSGEGPLTVFAPTDAAFAEGRQQGTLQSLLKPENKEKLASDPASSTSSSVQLTSPLVTRSWRASAKTLLGQKIKFGIDNGRLTVQNANIIGTDLKASNGVVHVIDTVILPN